MVSAALLVLDVLLLAAACCLLARTCYRFARRRRLRSRVPAYTVRRCDACRMTWQAEPDVDSTRLLLLVRRRERRRARAGARPAKGWAKARGWNRCPSCLSARVRTSGDGGRSEEADSRLSLEAVGYFVTTSGIVLVGVAALGFASRA